jgi:hypothetical protein
MFYWLFRRYMRRFFRESFDRKVIVAGTLTVPPKQ